MAALIWYTGSSIVASNSPQSSSCVMMAAFSYHSTAFLYERKLQFLFRFYKRSVTEMYSELSTMKQLFETTLDAPKHERHETDLIKQWCIVTVPILCTGSAFGECNERVHMVK